MLSGNVLITGGAGFLGRAILARAQREEWPCRFTVYSRDEEKQWKLRDRFPAVRCILGDVRDAERLTSAMPGHETVIHAAAIKFVPEAEFNVLETVQVNVNGTRNVALAAVQARVKEAIFVSTDKACLPVNLYGATKMVGERIWAEYNGHGLTRFSTARYGNVVGSTGSIIPVFRRQLKERGKVTVTDPAMTRFWMGTDEAIDCILGALHWGGRIPGVTVASMCRSMSIAGVAAMVASEADGEIEIVGPRPGEKKHETLVHEYEIVRAVLDDDDSHRGRFLILPSTYSGGLRALAFEHGLAFFDGATALDPYTSDQARPMPSEDMRRYINEAEALSL